MALGRGLPPESGCRPTSVQGMTAGGGEGGEGKWTTTTTEERIEWERSVIVTITARFQEHQRKHFEFSFV